MADLVAPVSTTNGDKLHLRRDDAAADGRGHLLGALGAQADVAGAVADQDVADEAVALTGGSHLLHGVDLHHLILEHTGLEELVNDLVLLDRERVEVDVLNSRDLAVLDEAAELGDRHPLLLLLALALALALLLALVAEAALSEAALTHGCCL